MKLNGKVVENVFLLLAMFINVGIFVTVGFMSCEDKKDTASRQRIITTVIDMTVVDKSNVVVSARGVGIDDSTGNYFLWGNGDSSTSFIGFIANTAGAIQFKFSAYSNSVNDSVATILAANDTISVISEKKSYMVNVDVSIGDTVKIILFDYYDGSIDHNVVIDNNNFSYFKISGGDVVIVDDSVATILWNANEETDLSNYLVYFGESPAIYEYAVVSIDTAVIVDITQHEFVKKRGVIYYTAVSAVDTAGNESELSNEVSYLFLKDTDRCDINADGRRDQMDDLLFDSFYGQTRAQVESKNTNKNINSELFNLIMLSFDRCDFNSDSVVDFNDALLYDLDCGK